MSNPFLAEIRIFPFNFAPVGWALCNGQLLPISQNTALFTLIGTYYGGDGRSNFALPNFQGVGAVGWGQGPGLSYYDLGQIGGQASVTLTAIQVPSHNHPTNCSSTGGGQISPQNNVWGDVSVRGSKFYANVAGNAVQMNNACVGLAGGSLPHNNMPPYLTLNFCIALQGVYPSRN